MAYRDESKNFYCDIKISTPDGKRSARLTDTLMKQWVKADIVEAIASEDQGGASSLTIAFIEADFLPDSLNKTPAEGVDGRGYITNRTGALIDLRFDGEKGFTYVTQAELESGITRSSRTQSSDKESVKFMFEANNIVEITWGNLEPKTSRTRQFRIGTINYATGGSGNTLTLQCFDIQKDMARLQVSEGIAWVDKQGKPLSLKQILNTIALIFGARLDFDDKRIDPQTMTAYQPPTGYVLDRNTFGGDTAVNTNNNPIYLTRNQPIDAWLKELARTYNSTYEIYDDPILGTPVIRFTAYTLRYKKVIKTLTYRDPNGTMLDFQFNSIAGEVSKSASGSAIDEDGKSESNYQSVKLVEVENKADPNKLALNDPANNEFYDPIPLVYSTRARELIQRDLYGTSITLPDTTESQIVSATNSKTLDSSFMGFITVKMVGHPDFKPDVYKIDGVGVRASTDYRFFQVQHSLSAGGYVCSMQGKTQKAPESGKDNNEQIKANSDYNTVELVKKDN